MEASEEPMLFFRLRDEGLKAYCQTPSVEPCAAVRQDTEKYREDIGDDLLLMKKHFKVTGRRSDFVLVCRLKE